MKCEECQNVIEEYFDGELDERAVREVRAHLMSCEACARELEALKDEQNVFALYVRDVEVSPALWKGVADRIRAEEKARQESPLARWRQTVAQLFSTPRLSPALTFALLVLSVGATAGLMKFIQSNNTSTQPVARIRPDNSPPAAPRTTEVAVSDNAERGEADGAGESTQAVEGGEEELTPPYEKRDERGDRMAPAYRAADRFESRRPADRASVGFADEASPDQLVREAEQKYMAAIALLARDAKRRRSLLEPDVRARFEQTLATVDRTINETRRAARQQPDDPVAVQFMLSAYAKKVEVLREMASYRVEDRDIQ